MTSLIARSLSRMLKEACLGIFLLITACGTFAQAPTYTPKFSPFIDNNVNGFWEYLPRDYDADISTNYPLLIYIHGAGDMGSVQDTAIMAKINRNGPAKLISKGTFPESFTVNGKSFRFIVIAPQIKNGVTGRTSIIDPATIDAVVEYARATYRVDPTRIYVSGMSMGGGGTWDYAGSEAGSKKIAAIAVAAGAADLTSDQAANIASQRVAVLATHNTVDQTVYVSRTIQNISAIESKLQFQPGPKAVYWETAGQHNPQESDNGEHNVWTRTFEDIEPGITIGGNLRDTLGINVYEWMLGYTNFSEVVVPIVWEEFTAKEINKKVELGWKISSQGNTKNYVIEKSANDREFVAIDSLPAQTEGNTLTYNFTDSFPYIPETFYRIRQVDNDDQYAYSPIRKITIVQIPDTTDPPIKDTAIIEIPGSVIRVFPNPFSEKIQIMLPAMDFQPITIRISDSQGKLIQAIKTSYSGNVITINSINKLHRGLHFITLANEKGRILFTKKIIKL